MLDFLEYAEIDNLWIKIYRIIAIVLFFFWVLFGVFAGIGDSAALWLDVGLGGDDDGFFDFFFWLLIGVGIGFVQFVLKMLIVQFLNNVQAIRDAVER